MLIKVDLDSDLYRKIGQLVREGKYSDLYEFVKIAISNQIQEEGSEQQELFQQEIRQKESPLNIRRLSVDIQNELHEILTGISLEKNEILPSPSPLIWSFYNRFFPVKVIVRKLATMIHPKEIWFSLDEVREKTFEFAESISDELKSLEDEEELGRNEKISTAMPLPKSETRGLKGTKKKKKLDKIAASELRFKEQFVGRYIKKDVEFKGACFELGLIRVKTVNEECFITLSELGKEFALLDNPILDEEKYDSNFSDEEVRFISEKIIPKFKLENKIITIILSKLEKTILTPNELDEIFKTEMIKYYQEHDPKKSKNITKVTSERVATMGRLSELKLVYWNIESGLSQYSLPKNN